MTEPTHLSTGAGSSPPAIAQRRTPRAGPIRRGRINKLEPLIVRWILTRAAAFVRSGRVIRPAFSYRELARNLRRSRRIEVNQFSIRKLVVREAPEIARMRGDCYPFARSTRREAWAVERNRLRFATGEDVALVSGGALLPIEWHGQAVELQIRRVVLSCPICGTRSVVRAPKHQVSIDDVGRVSIRPALLCPNQACDWYVQVLDGVARDVEISAAVG